MRSIVDCWREVINHGRLLRAIREATLALSRHMFCNAMKSVYGGNIKVRVRTAGDSALNRRAAARGR